MQHKDKLSDAERIARRKESTARYCEKNRDKCREASRVCQAKRRLESEEVRTSDKAYKQTEKYKAQQLEYRTANREKLNAATIAWQKANPEIFKTYQKQYAIDHSERQKSKAMKWRQSNLERSKEQGRTWREKNPDLNVLKAQKYRARKLQAGAELPKTTIKNLMLLQRGRCAICKAILSIKGYHLDHIMPLKLGGLHAIENVQLLCPTCNCKKHAKHPVDFMQSLGFLI